MKGPHVKRTQSVAVVGESGRAKELADLFAGQGFDVHQLALSDRGHEPLTADLIVEAVPEEATAETIRAIAAVAEEALIVTTASTHSVTELATETGDPARVAGLHFGPQGAAAEVLEIVAADQSDPDVIEELTRVVERLGKQPVSVKDSPGFLVDWLFLPFLNDVVQAFDEELATAEDIDAAVRLGLGYRKGPFEMLAEIGVERHLATTTAAHAATHDARFAPPARLRRMATAQANADQKEGN